MAVTFVCDDDQIKIMDEVKSRFIVKIEEMPETIDGSKYSILHFSITNPFPKLTDL